MFASRLGNRKRDFSIWLWQGGRIGFITLLACLWL